MLKRLLFISMAAMIALTMASAAPTNSKLILPLERTSPTDGKQMYTNYCAPCHGVDGRGNGPAAKALKNQPADLTGLAKANHGKYPDTHIVSVVQFGTEVTAHGSMLMPVWGPILGRMNRTNSQEKDLRVSNLSRYLETLQVK